MKPEPTQDPQLQQWLQALPTEQPSEELAERTMDQVYAVAREQRSRRHPLRMARLTAATSAALTLVLGLLIGWSDVTQAMLDPVHQWQPLSALAMVGLVGLLLWQLDAWLQVVRRRMHREN